MTAQNPDPDTGQVNLFEPGFVACPHQVYERLRSQCPVTRAALTLSPVISRYEDVVWALMNSPEFLFTP